MNRLETGTYTTELEFSDLCVQLSGYFKMNNFFQKDKHLSIY